MTHINMSQNTPNLNSALTPAHITTANMTKTRNSIESDKEEEVPNDQRKTGNFTQAIVVPKLSRPDSEKEDDNPEST